MELLIVIILILGTPFLIGFGLGRLTKGRSITKATGQLDAMWHSGYDAGIKAERLHQARQRASRHESSATSMPDIPVAVSEPVDTTPDFDSRIPSDPPSPAEPTATKWQQNLGQSVPHSETPAVVHAKSVQSTTVVPEPVPLETPAQKQRRTDRNINITLYSATLLIVTASALFISAAVPVAIIIGGLLTVTVAFYLSGLALHTWAPRLKPAAVAFVGTAIALVPLNGLTWWLQSQTSGPLIWFLTSLLGGVMLVGATLRLRSTLGIYLTMPLIVSTVISAGANLQRGYLWALLFAVVFAMLTNWLVRVINFRNKRATDPEAFGARYLQATEQTSLVLVPLVVVVSWFLTGTLTPLDFFILYLVATVYFGQAIRFGNARFRGLHITGTYLMGLLTIATAIPAFEIPTAAAMTSVGIYAAAAALSIYWLWHQTRTHANSIGHWGIGAIVGLSGAYLVGLFTGILYQLDQLPEPPQSWNPTWLAFVVITVGIIAHNLRRPHRLVSRILLLSCVPAMAIPAYFLYPWTSFTAVTTTLLIITVLAVQYRVTTQGQETPAVYEKYVALNVLVFFSILLSTQIARMLSSEYQYTIMVLSILGTLWATAILHHTSQHQPQPPVPVVLWMVLTTCITLTNITFGIAASLDNTLSTVMISTYAVLLIGTVVSGAMALPRNQGDKLTTAVVIGTVIAVQLFAIALWVSFTAQWATIVALLLLAATCFRTSSLVNVAKKTILRLCFMVAGQLSTMTAGTVLVSELGGDGSLQRLVTALIATAGAFLLAARNQGRLAPRQLASHRWFVVLIVLGLMIAELIFGQDRAVIVLLAFAITALATLMRSTYGGGWLIAPALWFAAWNLSDFPEVFNGWITGPWYTSDALVWGTLLAAIVTATVLVLRRNSIFSSQRSLHSRSQAGSAVVFLAMVSYVFSFALEPAVHALLVGGLSIALATVLTKLAAKFWGRPVIILGVLLGIFLLASYGYAILRELADTTGWLTTPAVLWGLAFALLATVFATVDVLLERRGSLQPESPAQPLGPAAPRWQLLADRLYLQSGVLIVALTSLASVFALSDNALPLTMIPAQQAVTSGVLVVAASWWLATQISRNRRIMPARNYSLATTWIAQTVAYLLSLGIIAQLWWLLTSHADRAQARYWLVVGLAVGIGLWSIRFAQAHTASHQIWRNATLIVGSTVFTVNSLTLVTGATAWMQLSGLLGFAIVLALGLLYNYRPLSIWGAIGITAAVLWYLRDLTYIWVGLLGLALLVGAIWQLRRTTRDQEAPDKAAAAQEIIDDGSAQAGKTPPPPPPPTQSK